MGYQQLYYEFMQMLGDTSYGWSHRIHFDFGLYMLQFED